MTGWRNIIWAGLAVAALAAPAFAQGGGASSTGSISGEVKDAQGGMLPGVTVTATSPAQIGSLTAISNEAGIYRFPAVPPGEYRIAFELAGFQSNVRDGIRITLGFNAQVNVTLNVATLQETVTVSGESPVIDTSATRIQTNYDQQMLSSIPNARDMWSLLSTTPSVTLNRVDVGGSTAGTQTTYFAYGYSGQNRPLIEGINTTEGTSAAGFYLDYGSFEEVFIGAAGNSAEMPNPGVLTQFVGKSGGNRPSINVYYDYENGDIQSRNLDPEQYMVPGEPANGRTIRPDGNRLASYNNFNLGVGGPIMRDRMWGHFAYLNQQKSVAAPPAGVIQDGTSFDTKLFNYTGKATYQMNQSNKFIGYLQHGTKEQPYRTDSSNRLGAPVHISSDSTVLQASPSWVYKGEWNGTINQNAFAEVRAGQFGYNFGLDSNSEGVRYEDVVTNEITGGGRHWLNKRRRNQYTGAVSYFKDNFAGGSHNVKVGGEYLDESGNISWEQGYTDSVLHFLSNGAPTIARLYNSGTSSQNGLATTSLFVTDTWSIDRLTLNVGARFDRYRVHLPEQAIPVSRFNPVERPFATVDSVATFNHIVPRLGATYDLGGDGKTVLKANWGRFYFNPGVNLADSVNPNSSDQYVEYNWTDANGDRIFQEGEQGVEVGRAGGTAGAAIDPNLVNPHTDEASFFLERAVLADLGVRGGFVWKHDSDGWERINAARRYANFNVPVSIVDPGPDGSAATTADNGPNINGWNLDDVTRPANQVTETVPGYQGTYKTIELSANKRYGNRWSMNASYSYTWTDEFGNLYFNNRIGTAVPGGSFSHFGSYPLTPNEPTHHDYTNWNAKVSGTVDAGWGLRVTPVLKMQGGAPYGRFISAAFNYSASQIVLVEPVGTRRQETISLVDFRVEKQLRFAASQAKLGLFLDVFNALNANTNININWRSGAAFEKATTVLGPRIAKFGVKFDW
jgi:hypothetical protein